jgi:hypothetical protein
VLDQKGLRFATPKTPLDFFGLAAKAARPRRLSHAAFTGAN